MAHRKIHSRVFTTWNGSSMGSLRLMAFWPPIQPISIAKPSMFAKTPKGGSVYGFSKADVKTN